MMIASTTSIKNQNKKNVSFHMYVTLADIENHHDFTSYERLSSWYTKKDYRSFKLADKRRILSSPISKILEKFERSRRAADVRMLVLWTAQSIRRQELADTHTHNHNHNHNHNYNHNHNLKTKHDEDIGNLKLLAAVCKHHNEYFAILARLSGVENELDLLSGLT